MSKYKEIVYFNEQQRDIVRRQAKEANLSVSAYIKSFIPGINESNFHKALSLIIEKAEEYVSTNPHDKAFTMPSLFGSDAAWTAWLEKNKIGAGAVGKEFFKAVQSGEVEGVGANPSMRINNRATYHSISSKEASV